MADINITAAIVAGVGSGLVSTLGTVAALRVHITYLKESLVLQQSKIEHLENAAQRAHNRIDFIERMFKAND